MPVRFGRSWRSPYRKGLDCPFRPSILRLLVWRADLLPDAVGLEEVDIEFRVVFRCAVGADRADVFLRDVFSDFDEVDNLVRSLRLRFSEINVTVTALRVDNDLERRFSANCCLIWTCMINLNQSRTNSGGLERTGGGVDADVACFDNAIDAVNGKVVEGLLLDGIADFACVHVAQCDVQCHDVRVFDGVHVFRVDGMNRNRVGSSIARCSGERDAVVDDFGIVLIHDDLSALFRYFPDGNDAARHLVGYDDVRESNDAAFARLEDEIAHFRRVE